MTRPSKRAQVEAMGWRFSAIPRYWKEGALWTRSSTGEKSPASYDYKHPEGWMVNPPEDHPCQPRRFDGRSPNTAVRWAYDQAMAHQQAASADLSPVAALAVLMASAGKSGVVADGTDACPAPAVPDGALLALCREALGCDRIAQLMRNGPSCPWGDETAMPAFKARIARTSEAMRERDRLIPQVVNMQASTAAGVTAKAKVIGTMFENKTGLKSEAVRSLIADLLAVLTTPAEVAP